MLCFSNAPLKLKSNGQTSRLDIQFKSSFVYYSCGYHNQSCFHVYLLNGMLFRRGWGEGIHFNPALMTHNWQKWKSRFLTGRCHKIHREETVILESCNTLKIMIFVNMWNLGQFLENLRFLLLLLLITAWLNFKSKNPFALMWHM